MTDPSLDLTGLRVLAAFAHPDDEGFGCGGTLSMLVKGGAKVTLLCFTDGGAARRAPGVIGGSLAKTRRRELHAAMKIIGISDTRFLGYRDSGSVAERRPPHPLALPHAGDRNAARCELVELLAQAKPDIVITHDPTGGYGHPDHIAVSVLMTEAVRFAGQGTAGGAGDHLTALCYACFPRGIFRPMWQEMIRAGITPPFGGNTADAVGSPDEAVTTIIDVGAHVDVKIASLRCHRSQLPFNGPFNQLPPDTLRRILRTEYFSLASPFTTGPGADALSALGRAPGGADPRRSPARLRIRENTSRARRALGALSKIRSPSDAWWLGKFFFAWMTRRIARLSGSRGGQRDR